METISDTSLVEAALLDRERYADIVSRYYEPLRRYVVRLGGRSKADVEDILQESFIKAYVHLRSYDPAFSLSTWLYRIVHNETMSFFRKRAIRSHVSLDEFTQIDQSDELTPASALEELGTKELVGQALERLDEKYRTILVLRYLEEKSYDEIADILERPVGSVATLLHRAKKMLARELTALEKIP